MKRFKYPFDIDNDRAKMNANPSVQKVQEEFSYVFSWLQQTRLARKEEITEKLLQLDRALRQLMKEEKDETKKLNLTYPLIFTDSSLDNLNYMDPENDETAVTQARQGVLKAFEHFSQLYKDVLQ